MYWCLQFIFSLVHAAVWSWFLPLLPLEKGTGTHTRIYTRFFHPPAEQSDKNSTLIKQEMLALQAMLNTLDYKRKVSDTFCHLWFICFLPLFPRWTLKRVRVPF